MRIDYKYLEQVLMVFLNGSKSIVIWNDFVTLLDDKEKLFFHLEILADKGLMVSCQQDRPRSDLGLGRGFDLDVFMIDIPWRLTADGHDFALELSNPTILEAIIDEFKEQGISIVIDVAKKIALKQTEKLLQ